MNRLPFPTSHRRTSQVGELIHTDVCGPMPTTPSISGWMFYVAFMDDFSGMRTVYFMKKKSDVFKHLRSYLCKISETGRTIRTLRSDGGAHLNKMGHLKEGTGPFVNEKDAYFTWRICLFTSGQKPSVSQHILGIALRPANHQRPHTRCGMERSQT